MWQQRNTRLLQQQHVESSHLTIYHKSFPSMYFYSLSSSTAYGIQYWWWHGYIGLHDALPILISANWVRMSQFSRPYIFFPNIILEFHFLVFFAFSNKIQIHNIIQLTTIFFLINLNMFSILSLSRPKVHTFSALVYLCV